MKPWCVAAMASGLAGCGMVPNPAYQPGANFTQELAGNYQSIASCAFGNMEKAAYWQPIQKTDFPDRSTTRLSRYSDGTIMYVFQVDFIGQGPKVTKIVIPEPVTIGKVQPAALMAFIAPCSPGS